MKRPVLSILKDLGNEDAAARAGDEVWVRRAAGRATPAEEAELLARAEASEEEALLAQTTRPLSDEKMDELLAFAERAAATKGASTAPAPLPIVAKVTTLPRPQRARARAALVWGAPALAAAAALALFVRTRGPSGVALPAYAVAVEGATVGTRGISDPLPAGERRVASPGNWLTIVARPSEPVSEPVAALAYIASGTDVRKLSAPRVSPSGTVTLEGNRETLFGDMRGDVDVIVWIGPPDALPRRPADAVTLAGDKARKLVVELTLP